MLIRVKGFLLTLKIVEVDVAVVMGGSVRGFFERGSSLEGSSALFFKPTTSAGGVVTIFSTSARSSKSGGFSQTDVLYSNNKSIKQGMYYRHITSPHPTQNANQKFPSSKSLSTLPSHSEYLMERSIDLHIQ